MKYVSSVPFKNSNGIIYGTPTMGQDYTKCITFVILIDSMIALVVKR